jgi:hypothetical protein
VGDLVLDSGAIAILIAAARARKAAARCERAFFSSRSSSAIVRACGGR